MKSRINTYKSTSYLHIVSMLIIIFGCSLNVYGQRSSNTPIFISTTGSVGKNDIYSIHSNQLNSLYLWSGELEISQFFLKSISNDLINSYSKIGLGLSYLNLGSSNLGYGINAILYVEPYLKARGLWRFSLKGGMGLTWLSNPYDASSNATNIIYGSNLNVPFYVGVTNYFDLSPLLSIKLSGGYTHITNGGITLPNEGFNFPQVSIGIEQALSNYRVPPLPHYVSKRSRPDNQYDLTVGYASKSDTSYTNQRHIISAIPLYSRALTRLNAITGGGLVEYQISPLGNNYNMGIIAGNEFIINTIRIGQQLGYYIYSDFEQPDYLFQNYYFTYYFSAPISIGINFKSHWFSADYVCIRIGCYI